MTGRNESATPAPQPQGWQCDCCLSHCKIKSDELTQPNCGCLFNSDIGAIWTIRSRPTISLESTNDSIPFSDWLSINNVKVRNATLDAVLKALQDVVLIDENNQYYFWLEDVELAIEPLRPAAAGGT